VGMVGRVGGAVGLHEWEVTRLTRDFIRRERALIAESRIVEAAVCRG
jgi:hypothetical protein